MESGRLALGAGPVRYLLLETVRQYATWQLEGQGQAAADQARIAHCDQYLALAEEAAPQLVAHDQAKWLDRLDLELDNLRAAIGYSLKQADPVSGIRLAAALRVFWKARGHATEGVEALRALLDVPTAQESTLLRSRALATAAYLLEQTGGYETAEEYCVEARAIARSAGDDYLVPTSWTYVPSSCSAVGSGPPRYRSSSRGLPWRVGLRNPISRPVCWSAGRSPWTSQATMSEQFAMLPNPCRSTARLVTGLRKM